MTFALAVLSHTPLPVFVLLGFLVWQGWRSLHPVTQPLWRIVLLPALFLVWGAWGVARGPGSPGAIAASAAALGAACLLGLAAGPRLLAIDSAGRITRAGSVQPLMRNLVIFGLQYGLAVASSLRPDLRADLALAGSAVAGASLGYNAGWLAVLRREYRRIGAAPRRASDRPA